MADGHFRYRDLEMNQGHKKNHEKRGPSFAEMTAHNRPESTPAHTGQPPKKTSEASVVSREDLNLLFQKIASLESKVDAVIGTSTPKTSPEAYVREIPHYTSKEYLGIEYYVYNDLLIIYNGNTSEYIVGDTSMTNVTLDAVIDDIEKSDPAEWDYPNASSQTKLYVDDFLKLYSKLIAEMTSAMGNISSIYGMNGEEQEVEEEEPEEEIEEEEEDLSEEESEETEPEPAPSIETLPDINEVEGEPLSNSSLREYARAIDQKITDETVETILAKARSSRRDRSIQLEYIPPKK